MPHWIVDEETGKYFQPDHNDPGLAGETGNNNDSTVHQWPIYYCGTAREFKRFQKYISRHYENGGTQVPGELLDEYPELQDIE